MEDLKLNESLSRKHNDVKGCRSLLSVCLVYASTPLYPYLAMATTMAIRVVEFSRKGYKIRKIFCLRKEIIEF